MNDGNVDTWHDHMYVHHTWIASCNIIVASITHLQQFKNNCHMQLHYFSKNQTWLTMDVCMVYIYYCIKNQFSTHFQL
jgi:hypothetical protein